jgi:glutamate formiminotransferase
LIAFNVNLGAARSGEEIAALVRERDGGFPGVGRSGSSCRGQLVR